MKDDDLVVVGLKGGDVGQSDDAVCVDLDRGLVSNGEEWAALVRRDRLDALLVATGATIVREAELWDGTAFGDGNGGTVERQADGTVDGQGLNRSGLDAPEPNESLLVIRKFPSLAAALDKLSEPPPDLVFWLKLQTASIDAAGLRIGTGRRYAAHLLLHLWGEEPTFDLRTALGTWDTEHRAAAKAVLFELSGERDGVPDSDTFAAGRLTVP